MPRGPKGERRPAIARIARHSEARSPGRTPATLSGPAIGLLKFWQCVSLIVAAWTPRNRRASASYWQYEANLPVSSFLASASPMAIGKLRSTVPGLKFGTSRAS